MAEISKTARQAMEAGNRRDKKDAAPLTPAEQIKAARNLHAAKLFIPPHMIDNLFAEYDRVVEELRVERLPEIF